MSSGNIERRTVREIPGRIEGPIEPTNRPGSGCAHNINRYDASIGSEKRWVDHDDNTASLTYQLLAHSICCSKVYLYIELKASLINDLIASCPRHPGGRLFTISFLTAILSLSSTKHVAGRR